MVVVGWFLAAAFVCIFWCAVLIDRLTRRVKKLEERRNAYL